MTKESPDNELQAHYESELRRLFGGRRWILAMDVLVSMTGFVRRLHEYGADGILCIAASRGAGEGPDPELSPEPIVFDVRGDDMMSGIRAGLAKLDNLPPEAVEQVDAFDPDHTARVIGTIFDPGSPVAGRQKYGARDPSWQRLEDKTVIDAVWDAIGIPRAQSRIVDASEPAAQFAAAEELDEGAGTVWVVDNREGFHGGASYVRHVQTAGQARAVSDFLAEHGDAIRIMPFLAGLPCSIHGIVFRDDVVALRPCEMIVFKRPGTTEFQYGRAGTFWDPPAGDREQMRTTVRRVGEHLRTEYGYRGAFTIDGVMTSDGFRPTELNPRFGAALGDIASPAGVPLLLMNLAIVEGEEVDWRPRELEDLLVSSADASRHGGTMAVVRREVSETVEASLVFDGHQFREATDDEEPAATVRLGPHPAGGFLFGRFVAERTPVGDSVAPRAAALLAWADRKWELGIGELQPARDVRT